MGKMNTPVVKMLDIRRAGYQYRPVLDRVSRHQTIRERAEFLAHEIFDDRLASEAEIADAIEVEIRRFSARRVKNRKPEVSHSGSDPR